jgi:hypothetical protein
MGSTVKFNAQEGGSKDFIASGPDACASAGAPGGNLLCHDYLQQNRPVGKNLVTPAAPGAKAAVAGMASAGDERRATELRAARIVSKPQRPSRL